MGSISEIYRPEGKSTWQLCIRLKGAPKIYKTFKTRKDAEEFEADAERDIKNGVWISPANPDSPTKQLAIYRNQKISEAIDMFMASGRIRTRHRALAPTAKRAVGHALLGDIRYSWTNNFVDRMKLMTSRQGRPYKMASIIAALRFVGLVSRWRARMLDLPAEKLPFDVDELPAGWDASRTRRLEPGEEEAILLRLSMVEGTRGSHLVLLMRLALETGARLQELVLSEWNEFEIGRRLWLLPALRTKSRKARPIPLSRMALGIMDELGALRAPGSRRVFHTLGAPNSISHAFADCVKLAGVKDFRFHDLRHEACSRMVIYKQKLSIYEIMQIVGHADMATFNRYAHLRGDEMADRMD